MVRRILTFFGRELQSIPQAAFLLASSGLCASLFSLFRDRMLGALYGASRPLDIYYASFRVPDFIYTLSLFFAASTALVPVMLEKYSHSKKEAQTFFSGLLFMLGSLLVVMTAATYLLMPYLLPYIAPGFSAGERAEVLRFSRILLLSPFLLGISNLASVITQSFRRLGVYALSPIFYNVGIIGGIWLLEPKFGLEGIVWGVIVGAFLHLAVQLPVLKELGFSLIPRQPEFSEKFFGFLFYSAPRAIGLSVNQFVLLIMTAIGSTLGAGALTVFTFAMGLQAVPVSIIGLSYSVGAFPSLAASLIKKEKEEFLRNFSLAFRHIVFWSLPATVLFMVLRAQIVRVIYGTGAFSWVDTRLTAAALALFSFSVLSQGLIMLLVRAFYAAGYTFLPVKINVVSSVAAAAAAFWFLHIFQSYEIPRAWFLEMLRVSDISQSAVLVLPLAFSLGSLVNLLLLLVFFKRIFGKYAEGVISRSFAETIFASALVGAGAYYALQVFAAAFDLETFFGIFMQGFLSGMCGLALGALAFWKMGNKEFFEFAEALHRKFRGEVAVVSAEPERLP
ncbi:MAG: lipid II flippase MurJ [Patescibacteria group bacterium]